MMFWYRTVLRPQAYGRAADANEEVRQLVNDLTALQAAHPEANRIAMFHRAASDPRGALEIYLTPQIAELSPFLIAKYRAHPVDKPAPDRLIVGFGGDSALAILQPGAAPLLPPPWPRSPGEKG